MQDKVGPGLYVQHYFDLYPKLYENGVLFLTSARLTEIHDGYATVETKSGGKVMPKADYVFFATGVRSENSLVETAKKVCSKVYTVGDAEKAGTILNATSTAFSATAKIK